MCEASCTWSGQMPPRNYKNPTYSCKVFLGGVPWDITECKYANLLSIFSSPHSCELLPSLGHTPLSICPSIRHNIVACPIRMVKNSVIIVLYQ